MMARFIAPFIAPLMARVRYQGGGAVDWRTISSGVKLM
jgi:hypothetical protein